MLENTAGMPIAVTDYSKVRNFMATMELREAKCHFLWGAVLCFNIFLLPWFVSYLEPQNWGLIYFISGIIAILMTLMVYPAAIRDIDYVIRDNAVAGVNQDVVYGERWSSFLWRHRLIVLLRQCIRLEFFGWIVFFCGTLGAINHAMEQVRDDVAQGKAEATYLNIIDRAAFDLTRAAIVGVIVLFFAQILRQYKYAIDNMNRAADKTKTAADKASDAVSDAGLAIAKAKDAIPQLEYTIDRGIESIKRAFEDLHRSLTVEEINNILKTSTAETRELIKDISSQLNQNLEEVWAELRSPAGDHIEAACFYSLYIAYMTSESLTFTGQGSDGQKIERGRGSCEFATRFVNYSIAVRKIVESLEVIGNGRFEYYTLFIGRPARFFNIENGGADPQWSIDFLKFCRSHGERGIYYKRYFLSRQRRDRDHDSDRGRLYQTHDITDDLDSLLVCSRDTGEPILWGASHIRTDLHESLKAAAASCLVQDPGFIVKLYDSELEHLPPLPNEVEWKKLRDVLPLYFNPAHKPEILEFTSYKNYIEFFGHEVGHRQESVSLPNDLFAVWDKQYGDVGGWRLCMGTMSPSEYGAVRLMFATPMRSGMRQGSWDEMAKKLSRLFKAPVSEATTFKPVPMVF